MSQLCKEYWKTRWLPLPCKPKATGLAVEGPASYPSGSGQTISSVFGLAIHEGHSHQCQTCFGQGSGA
eukprot:5395376-Amphidinium_carterae.1